MSEREPAEPVGELHLKELRCRRIDQRISVDEHARCPYCFGKLAEVQTGRYERFCDYKPGVDPIVFGCPVEDERTRRG